MTDAERQLLLEWIEEQLDGNADAAVKEQLQSLISGDREALRFYVQQCQLHSMLAWEHGVPPDFSFDQPVSGNASSQDSFWRRNPAAPFLAIAATIAVACGFWAVSLKTASTVSRPGDVSSPGDPSRTLQQAPVGQAPPISEPRRNDPSIDLAVAWEDREPVATVQRMVAARLVVDRDRESSPQKDGLRLTQGDIARAGQYELSEGLVSLRFDSGVKVIVKAPAVFDIDHAMRMVLHRGSISALVSPQGKGFIVDTPSVSAVDYGTEFAVEVGENQRSEVHVFDGRVDVKPLRAPPNTDGVRLTSDEATRVDSSGVIPQGIDIAHDRFIRDLNEPDPRDAAAADAIAALRPMIHLRMGIVEDGRSLVGVGRRQCVGELVKGPMIEPPFAPGRVGGAIRFGGPLYRSFAYVEDYPKTTTDQLTVCAWVRAESRPRWAAIAKHWAVELIDDGPANTGLGGQFHFGLFEDDGDLEVQVRDHDGIIVSVREGEKLPLHCWQHVAFVADGQTLTLYRNGVPVASQPCEGVMVDGPERMGIGAKLSPDGLSPDLSNPGFWQGRIDELAIWHRALTADQIGTLIDEERCD